MAIGITGPSKYNYKQIMNMLQKLSDKSWWRYLNRTGGTSKLSKYEEEMTMKRKSVIRSMRSMIRRSVCGVLSVIMLAGAGVTAQPVETQAASTVSVSRFNEMLKAVSGTDAWEQGDSFYGSSAALTNEVAAQMALRADESINGTAYDENLYGEVTSRKRIKDISKADKTYRKALTVCFVKGIMPGKSPAQYSHQRKLSPKAKTTPAQARSIVNRVQNKGKRIKLTSDGQVTRTTNLPKNAKQYRYILASFPNSYYEPKFDYQLWKFTDGHAKVNLVDYASPKNVLKVGSDRDWTFKDAFEEYSDDWVAMVEKNLTLRFNYNYKTTDFNKWKAELLTTFPMRYQDKYSKSLNGWRKATDACQVQTKSYAVVADPSSIYMSGGDYFIRCYVKFKVNANRYFSADSLDQNVYVYGSHSYFPGLKLNKTYAAVIDVPFGDWTINGHGRGLTVIDSYLGRAGDTRKAS